MAKTRTDRLGRLVAVQRQIEQVAEMDLAGLNRDRMNLCDRIDNLCAGITSANPVHAGFTRLYGVEIARLEVRERQLEGRIRLQEKRFLSEKAKTRRLKDRFGEAAADDARNQADEAIYDLLDGIGDRALQKSGNEAGAASRQAPVKLRRP